MDYPITGCGRPACVTCHPVPIPIEEHAESVLSLAVGFFGVLLVFLAALYLLPGAW